jgi:ABC-type branched-subunit amino acid transport system substrate-binding protein
MEIKKACPGVLGFACSLFLAFSLFSADANAQEIQRHKIAVFTPLYLDSAFDASGNFRYEKTGARFAAPGIDFYYGVQMALDSLKKRGAPLEVYIYDTKGKEQVSDQMSLPELDDVEMIIAHSNPAETRALAEAAQRKKIPFISATLPNDAGVYNNPYFVVLNSTLQAHIEGIYRFLQKYHPLEKVVVFSKRGAQEDQIKDYLNEFAKATMGSKLDLKIVDVGNDMSPQVFAKHLDSTRKNIVICGSLEEYFGNKMALTMAALNKRYPITLMGMPTWDNFNLGQKELSNLEIIYSTPFYYNRGADLETELSTRFSNEMSVRASELFFRGYETTLRFALLLLDTKKDIASNLTRKGNFILTPMDIQPVFKDKTDMNLDYFENKFLYFIKVLGGSKNVLY